MRYLILLSIVLAFPVFAVDDKPPQLEALPEAPDPIPPAQSGEVLEPDITIIRKEKKNHSRISSGWQAFYD